MSKQLVLSALALATLALNACSSEPSDWRADKKVSVDMVEPGSRSSDNFDQNTEEAAHQSKGGAIERPINSEVTLDEPNARDRVTAEEVRTADAKDATHTSSAEAIQSDKKATSDQKAETAEPTPKN
ncbi:hypothetical protein MUN84_11125 [Hymenobacter sp. 5516J-16]|uniref:Uncharacterized protein n=1 Tax=Hymenobacter sublimis TaxID=2933777 RepID=A0ABY4J830_9BACT|nr:MULTISPECIES: hypothetical protein [Hymenobacter]UOQ79020.1 hypothetical protein MUN84_11125 [Hymenobacter sp. 5516J-16]UPL48968.1 hypothetical protein MWH26_17490 [Hymenobacter sublimis]